MKAFTQAREVVEMQKELPDWAMEPATAADLIRAREALGQGRLELQWPDAKGLRKWARHHGWRTPWLGFERAFVTEMLENEANFALALGADGLEVRLPKREHFIEAKDLKELDALYDERPPSDPRHPTAWGTVHLDHGVLGGRGVKSWCSVLTL